MCTDEEIIAGHEAGTVDTDLPVAAVTAAIYGATAAVRMDAAEPFARRTRAAFSPIANFICAAERTARVGFDTTALETLVSGTITAIDGAAATIRDGVAQTFARRQDAATLLIADLAVSAGAVTCAAVLLGIEPDAIAVAARVYCVTAALVIATNLSGVAA